MGGLDNRAMDHFSRPYVHSAGRFEDHQQLQRIN
jgi:hypothetical protein